MPPSRDTPRRASASPRRRLRSRSPIRCRRGRAVHRLRGSAPAPGRRLSPARARAAPRARRRRAHGRRATRSSRGGRASPHAGRARAAGRGRRPTDRPAPLLQGRVGWQRRAGGRAPPGAPRAMRPRRPSRLPAPGQRGRPPRRRATSAARARRRAPPRRRDRRLRCARSLVRCGGAGSITRPPAIVVSAAKDHAIAPRNDDGRARRSCAKPCPSRRTVAGVSAVPRWTCTRVVSATGRSSSSETSRRYETAVRAGLDERVPALQGRSLDPGQGDGDALAGLGRVHVAVVHLHRTDTDVEADGLRAERVTGRDTARPQGSRADRADPVQGERAVDVQTGRVPRHGSASCSPQRIRAPRGARRCLPRSLRS